MPFIHPNDFLGVEVTPSFVAVVIEGIDTRRKLPATQTTSATMMIGTATRPQSDVIHF